MTRAQRCHWTQFQGCYFHYIILGSTGPQDLTKVKSTSCHPTWEFGTSQMETLNLRPKEPAHEARSFTCCRDEQARLKLDSNVWQWGSKSKLESIRVLLLNQFGTASLIPSTDWNFSSCSIRRLPWWSCCCCWTRRWRWRCRSVGEEWVSESVQVTQRHSEEI